VSEPAARSKGKRHGLLHRVVLSPQQQRQAKKRRKPKEGNPMIPVLTVMLPEEH
jgi:hypothetical protein